MTCFSVLSLRPTDILWENNTCEFHVWILSSVELATKCSPQSTAIIWHKLCQLSSSLPVVIWQASWVYRNLKSACLLIRMGVCPEALSFLAQETSSLPLLSQEYLHRT